MKKITLLFVLVVCGMVVNTGYSQTDAKSIFKMSGRQEITVPVNRTVGTSSDLPVFAGRTAAIYGLELTADIEFSGDDSWVRVILTDSEYREYLVFETYPLLAGANKATIDGLSEETCNLKGVVPINLRVELQNAKANIRKIAYSAEPEPAPERLKAAESIKLAQDDYKMNCISQAISDKGLNWRAGLTDVSRLTYAEKKKLYGQGTFPAGIEYYIGGIYETGRSLKGGMETSLMTDSWDWRNRHGKNWISPVKDQASCGSCWAFAATGAMEAMVNVFYNQNTLNPDLSEQELLSCSGAGTCTGGYPSMAISYMATTGIIDEAAFPYSASEQSCSAKSATPSQQFKIAGRADFGSAAWPASEDNLKKMIIKYGPISGGLYNWSHAMTLVGWQVVKAGDSFYYRDLAGALFTLTVDASSSLIGKTVWIFKNSWGNWGDGGYVYVETDITNIGWTHALVSPVTSLKQALTVACTDADGDGYYWWGVGPKPANCPACPDLPDGDDSNASLGPLDEFGNCVPNTPAPVASFSADKVAVTAGAIVNFTDLSLNTPVQWSWSFPGGTPSLSNEQNPKITYSNAGSYDVTLTVTNSLQKSSTIVKTSFIVVSPVSLPLYCNSKGSVSTEWIASVSVNGVKVTSGSSGTSGYQLFTTPGMAVKRGVAFPLIITPGYTGKAVAEYVTVWVDLNQDMDFDEANEKVLALSGYKAATTKSITLPTTALLGNTRMRISMKRATAPTACETFINGEVEDYVISIGAKSGVFEDISETIPSLKLYPNPCDRELAIEVDEVRDNPKLAIYDMNGQMIMMEPIREIVTRINVGSLSAGIYVIMVQNGDVLHRERFVKN